MIIKDSELEAYLADKLLVKPKFEPSSVEVQSRYRQVQEILERIRAANNKKVTKDYRLK